MKVLQINSVCGRGSTGRIVLDIHNALSTNGYKSYIAYGREKAKNCSNTIRIGRKMDIYTHVIKTRLFDKHGFGSKQATKDFIKKAKELDPDIIHLHNIHGYYINIKILFDYLKQINKQVIWTLHDCWPFTGHCAYFDFVGCGKWKKGCFKCPQKLKYPTSWLFDNSSNNWKIKKELFTGIKNLTLVSPSQWLADLVKKSFLKEYPVVVIPNGIDISVFKPTPSDFRKKYRIEDKFVILGVANVWEERKGLKYFFELSKLLNEDEVIVLVGLSRKQKKNLPKNIIGLSKTNSVQELVGIYTTADVFVNPTLEDNYPTVNLEAQACGTFVITFDSGGAKETIIKKGETGWIISKENTPNKIFSKLSEVKQKKIKIKEIKNSWLKAISKSSMINGYLALYKSILFQDDH